VRISSFLRRSGAGLAALGAAVVLGALAVIADDAVQVSQRDRRFTPDSLHLARGGAIRILNDDRVTHHLFVESRELQFDSGEQPVGRTVELKFDKQGNFLVQCAIHPTMRLRVQVD
jgi:plastocyanin